MTSERVTACAEELQTIHHRLEPVVPFGGGTRIGAGWVTTQVNDSWITWAQRPRADSAPGSASTVPQALAR